MKDILLNKTIRIDLERLIAGKLLVQANSGGGKSWLIRRLVEQAYGKVQIIILDPEGEFSTLREKFDFVLAGKGGDTPAEPRSATLLARRLLELKVSAIIDLYELHPQDRKRFVRLFLDAMVNIPKELYNPCLVVLDEAHMFAPERGESEALSAVIDMASRGRKREQSLILATQRISKLHKDAAAECNNKLIGRSSLDIDRKRAADELGITGREEILALRTLKPGEFFAFGPAISDEVIKVTVGNVQTSIPKGGATFKVTPPTPGIRKILGKLADLPQEAKKEAETVSELKNELRDLRRHKCEGQTDPKAIERVVAQAVKEKERELSLEFDASQRQIKKLATVLDQITVLVEGIDSLEAPKPANFVKIEPRDMKVRYDIKIEKPTVRQHLDEEISLSGPEQRILDAIAWLESIGNTEPEQTAVAFLAGYTYGGGGFNNPRGSLRTKGLVEYRGNCIALTDQGREFAKTPEEVLHTNDLHAKVLEILPGPERRLLFPLLQAYPNDLSNEELAEESGYKVGSGGFNNPKGRLRTLGLVEYPGPGRVKAKSLLFLEN